MPPTYDYLCEKCELEFEVIKSIHDYKTPEKCTKCGKQAIKIFSRQVHFIGTKIEDAEFNVGLGKITKSKRHRDELAKRMGLEELGNEKPEVIHKTFDQAREDKLRKSWEDI